MAKLVLSLNGVAQGEYELDRERLMIGRKPDSDIPIDNLSVSGKHAMVITILDDSFVEDLGSTNGTYINGKLVKKHALKNGDIISIGKHELRYIDDQDQDQDEEEEDGNFEKTMIIKPGSASDALAAAQAAEKAMVAATPAAESEGGGLEGAEIGGDTALQHQDGPPPSMPLGKLTVLNGPIAGKELELTKALITLGRPGSQVAVISRRPQGYFLTHIQSDGDGKRYPEVNGEPIGPKAYALQDGDLILLTGIKMEFNLH